MLLTCGPEKPFMTLTILMLHNRICICSQVQNKQLTVQGKIYTITSQRVPNKGNILKLGVNFLKEIIQLSKEVHISVVFKKQLVDHYYVTELNVCYKLYIIHACKCFFQVLFLVIKKGYKQNEFHLLSFRYSNLILLLTFQSLGAQLEMARLPCPPGKCKQSSSSQPALPICHLSYGECTYL